MKEMLYNDLIISTVLINDIFIPETFPKWVFLGTDSGIFFSKDSGVHFKYFMSGISATKIYSFGEINGEVFAGTDNGVYSLRNNVWKFVGLENKKIYSLRKFQRSLYAGTDSAIFKMNDDRSFTKIFETGFRIYQMAVFKNDLFAATPGGLLSVKEKKNVLNIPTLSVSSNGCLYIGTHFGIRKTYEGTEFYATALTEGIIRAVAVSSEGVLFAGRDDGLYLSKDEGKSFEKRLQNAHVFSLFTYPLYSETVFVGTWGRGLIRYKFANSP